MKRTFLFAIVCLLIAACTQVPHEILSTVEDLSGTYYGSAKVLERLERDGVIVMEEEYSLEDHLIITEIDKDVFHYQVSLQTQYNKETLLFDGERYFGEDFHFSEGYDPTYGYSYDNKQEWQFYPKEDRVYLKLEHIPYEPAYIDDPDNPGNTIAEVYTRSYILEAKR